MAQVGSPQQRQPMKLRELEIKLQKVPPHPNPKPELEQYPTPAHIAAMLLYEALGRGDIEGKRVADLGCGTGILAMGAKMLGATEVVGIDIDELAIEIANRVAHDKELDIDFLVGDIEEFDDPVDTVIMNPPFGAQRKHADMPFLRTALKVSPVVYSMHMASTKSHVEKAAKALNGVITMETRIEFEIRHMFGFHTKERRSFEVSLFRFERPGVDPKDRKERG